MRYMLNRYLESNFHKILIKIVVFYSPFTLLGIAMWLFFATLLFPFKNSFLPYVDFTEHCKLLNNTPRTRSSLPLGIYEKYARFILPYLELVLSISTISLILSNAFFIISFCPYAVWTFISGIPATYSITINVLIACGILSSFVYLVLSFWLFSAYYLSIVVGTNITVKNCWIVFPLMFCGQPLKIGKQNWKNFYIGAFSEIDNWCKEKKIFAYRARIDERYEYDMVRKGALLDILEKYRDEPKYFIFGKKNKVRFKVSWG